MLNQLSFTDLILGSPCLQKESLNDRQRREGRQRLEIAVLSKGDAIAPGFKYVDARTPVSLVCGRCSVEFERMPMVYKNKAHRGGCSQCSLRGISIRAREKFDAAIGGADFSGDANVENMLSGMAKLDAAIAIKGDSKALSFRYVNCSTPVDLVCKTCRQVFPKTPSAYTNNNFRGGCPACAGKCQIAAKNKFFEKLLENGDRVSESSEFVDMRTRIYLACGTCDRQFDGTPTDYVRDRMSCDWCRGMCSIKAKEDLESKIVARGDSKGENYVYNGAKKQVQITCGACGMTTMRWPSHYKSKDRYGCISCNPKGGFNPLRPGILYYLAFYPTPDRAVYKIGITSRTVKQRYKLVKTPYEIIWTERFQSGHECSETEQRIVKEYAQYRCKDTPVDGIGNRELFDRDIMQGSRIRMTS